MSFTRVTRLKVSMDFPSGPLPVGTLATDGRRVYFEYDAGFLKTGIQPSPFNLPARPGLVECPREPFGGLPGLFDDSLADGWGRLLLDAHLRREGIPPDSVGPLDRLAFTGPRGMGALAYEPAHPVPGTIQPPRDLDHLAGAARNFLEGDATDVLPTLLRLNGSSAGARPKAMIAVNPDNGHVVFGASRLPQGHSHWLVKFPTSHDGLDAGAVEFAYAAMARDAGIDMAQSRLFPSSTGSGYFATQRFDRNAADRVHVHSLAGLLNDDFRHPSLDYRDVLAATRAITRDINEVERMYRRAVFNVLSHNRDDHSRNFAFIMTPSGTWRVSPAYDITFSSGPRGHQSMLVMGEGRKPSADHLNALAATAGLAPEVAADTIERTRAALARWPDLAREYDISPDTAHLITDRINLLDPDDDDHRPRKHTCRR